jgi:hypothetical protein
MQIFELLRTENKIPNGAQYNFVVQDAAGKEIAAASNTGDFVAAIVREHRRMSGLKPFYSIANYTRDYKLIGKDVNLRDESIVGVAIYGRPDISEIPPAFRKAYIEFNSALIAGSTTPDPASSPAGFTMDLAVLVDIVLDEVKRNGIDTDWIALDRQRFDDLVSQVRARHESGQCKARHEGRADKIQCQDVAGHAGEHCAEYENPAAFAGKAFTIWPNE